jgi:hypothetical protein
MAEAREEARSLLEQGANYEVRQLVQWQRAWGPRPKPRTSTRTIDNKDDTTVDPSGEDVPEEWRGQFLDNGEGFPVYNGPRAKSPGTRGSRNSDL